MDLHAKLTSEEKLIASKYLVNIQIRTKDKLWCKQLGSIAPDLSHKSQVPGGGLCMF